MSTGRNDLCPCGSGKKYKKCCLLSQQPKADELFRQRLHSMRNSLIEKILKHAKDVYGILAIDEAWDEFHLWENDSPFDTDAEDLQIFMPWFFYDWFPDAEDTNVLSDAPMDLAPAMSLLQSKRNRLDQLERDYLEECCAKGFSFYEILECWPGEGFKEKDILTGEFHRIVEKMGSVNLKPNDILFGKAVTINNLTTLEGCSTFIIPPIFKTQIIELRQDLEKAGGPVTHEILRKSTLEVLEVYQNLREAVLNPQMPVIQNTDGERLLPHKLTYEIESAEKTVDALAPLHLDATKEEPLKGAEFDKDGRLKSIEFPWIKKGNEKHKEWDNTVMGHITISGKELVVEVNSENRAMHFEAELQKRMPNGWKAKSKVIEPIEQHLKKARPQAQPSHQSKQIEDLNNHPEVQAHIAKMMEKHWENWIHQSIPALGNKTPLQAIKTKDGKEMLGALLNQFERDAERKPMPGQTVETIKSIRERLGL